MHLLERGALVAVVVDGREHTALMAAAAHRSGHVLDVLVDLDLGMGVAFLLSEWSRHPVPSAFRSSVHQSPRMLNRNKEP
jgi:hypothetical protein